jgi:hypothetical protein
MMFLYNSKVNVYEWSDMSTDGLLFQWASDMSTDGLLFQWASDMSTEVHR